jgi:hypothetical protein
LQSIESKTEKTMNSKGKDSLLLPEDLDLNTSKAPVTHLAVDTWCRFMRSACLLACRTHYFSMNKCSWMRWPKLGLWGIPEMAQGRLCKQASVENNVKITYRHILALKDSAEALED